MNKKNPMYHIRSISLFLCLVVFYSCGKVSPDAVDFELDYSWGTELGVNKKNPEIRLTGIPAGTKFLEVQLIDLDLKFADHGDVEKIAFVGSNVIPYGSLKKYIGPSPPPQGHLYEYTIRAIDENGVVVGIGKKAKNCCSKTD